MQYFTIFQEKLHSFHIQDHRNTVQKFLKSPIRPAGSNFDKRQICEEILKELRFNVIKNLLSLFFINSFIMIYNLKKRLKNSVFSVLIHTYIHTYTTHTHIHTHIHLAGFMKTVPSDSRSPHTLN